MGRIAKDAKDLILGNDGSDKEPVDFKVELQNAIKAGLITKADGTLLITSRTNCDKLAELISRNSEKEVVKASKDDGVEFDTPEEARKEEKKKREEKEERKRQEKNIETALEQQIQASQKEQKAKIQSEKNGEKQKEIERK